MDFNDADEIQENFPFLSGIRSQEINYIGIIQNADDKIISFYDFNLIRTDDEKQTFLRHGESWWWQSNRKLPIHIFLQGEMIDFRYCMKTMILKDVDIMFGPVTSLHNIIEKRIKRRQIQLVRKCD